MGPSSLPLLRAMGAAAATAAAMAAPEQLWPTPLYADPRGHGALAARLRPELLALMAVDPGVQKSNKESDGWHSSELLDMALHQKLGDGLSSSGAVLALHAAVVGAATAAVGELDATSFGPLARGGEHSAVSVSVQNMWANVNRRGDFNIMHTHPNSVLSGVFYVDAGVAATASGPAG
eukprot:SAG11_NODE_14805_length_599_cov_0.818000_1_plen_177_part_01